MLSQTVLQQLSKDGEGKDAEDSSATLDATPKIKSRRKRKSSDEEDVDQETDEIEDETSSTAYNISHLLLSMEALHYGSRRKLSRSNAKSANQYLSKAICKDGTMMTLLNHFKDDDVSRSIVWRLVGAVVESEVSDLRNKKFDVIKRAQKEIFGEGRGCVDALRLLCRWESESSVVRSIRASLTHYKRFSNTDARTQVRRVVSSTMSWLNVSDEDEDEEEKNQTMKKKKRSRKGRARQSVSPAKCMKILEFLLGGDGAYGA